MDFADDGKTQFMRKFQKFVREPLPPPRIITFLFIARYAFEFVSVKSVRTWFSGGFYLHEN